MAQETAADSSFHLSLPQALALARQQNKWISISQQEEAAAASDLKDAKNAVLPQVGVNGSYQRFSKVTLFEDGLSGGHEVPRLPNQNSAAVGADAAFTLFAGGRYKAAINEQLIKKELASLNTLDQTGVISLKVVGAYLGIIKLNEQDSLINEQVKRAATRLKNIQALYNNQKVTRSDVLRAELVLSNRKLGLEQTENDITIAISKLDVLLNLPEHTRIVPTDSISGAKAGVTSLSYLVSNAATGAYPVLKAGQGLLLQENRINAVKASNYPTLQLFSAYGINYPNYLGFPPVDQFYSVGFLGVRASYNISSLYHNKYKVKAAKQRLTAMKTGESAIKDNVNLETNALYIKYGESINRIKVAKESIEQATVNYRIVSAKYFNQLALLTDLLDADNLYLESRYNLIQSQTDALALYYQLLYSSGKL